MKSALNLFSSDLLFKYIESFSDSGGGTVDFQEFVGGLSAFSSRGGREEKLRCGSFFLMLPSSPFSGVLPLYSRI